MVGISFEARLDSRRMGLVFGYGFGIFATCLIYQGLSSAWRVGAQEAATWKLEKRIPDAAAVNIGSVDFAAIRTQSENPKSSAKSKTMFGRVVCEESNRPSPGIIAEIAKQ